MGCYKQKKKKINRARSNIGLGDEVETLRSYLNDEKSAM